MDEQPQDGLDFDRWCALARSDPDTFEAERRAAVDALILRAPDHRRQRLRCLQWRIEQERRQAGTPFAAYVRLSNLMWDSVQRQQDLLDHLFEPGPASAEPHLTACVVPFRRR